MASLPTKTASNDNSTNSVASGNVGGGGGGVVSSEATFFPEYKQALNLISILAGGGGGSGGSFNDSGSNADDKRGSEGGSKEDDDDDAGSAKDRSKNDDDNATEKSDNNDKKIKKGSTNDNESTTNKDSKTLRKKENDNALSKFRTILDNYLECPFLLDPYLEPMTSKLSHAAQLIIQRKFMQQQQQHNDSFSSDEDGAEKSVSLAHLFSALYALSKVRGRKRIQTLLPHNVSDVEPVLFTLQSHAASLFSPNQTDEEVEAKPWESTYVLLLWLGAVSLVPFDLHTIDSSASETKSSLVSSAIGSTLHHLSDAGPTREVASSTLSLLLSRPDMDDEHVKDEENELMMFFHLADVLLKKFLIMQQQQQQRQSVADASDSSENSKEAEEDETFLSKYYKQHGLEYSDNQKECSIFLVMGIIQTLASIFKKTSNRFNLLSRHLRGIELLWERALLLSEYASPSSAGKGKVSRVLASSLQLRRLLSKLFARVGCSYLPPKIASWRYQRGKRSLLQNLGGDGVTNTNAGNNTIDQDTHNTQQQNKVENDNDHEEEDLPIIPDQVEDATSQLLHSLTDNATIVRWSAAKGLGRITERLPSICAHDVLDALLQLTIDVEKDNAWHGSCLALAELARRGLLLPERLGEVVPVVIRAIQYDVRRGQHSVGSHVRDAACYTCWAFARAYAPSVLRLYVSDLSQSIVLASLFDREVNCRRAASAAFQECVGRQGADNFKHGISILTAADYFSLGNRMEAYTEVAFEVAKFAEYRRPIINHLYRDKLFHWDVDIRTLTSKSLNKLTELDQKYVVDTVLPHLLPLCTDENLFRRHGSLLGVAEILLKLGKHRQKLLSDKPSLSPLPLDESTVTLIAELVPTIEGARLYRGRGGEIMRSAVSRLIECLSLARLELTVKQQVRLLDSLDANLKQPNEEIQNAAAAGLWALTRSYFPVGHKGPSERLHGRVVDKYVSIIQTDDNPAATRGFTLALGQLPSKILAPRAEVLNTVLNCLCVSARPNMLVGKEGDAETRRNAILSLVQVCKTVGIGQRAKDYDVLNADSAPVVCLNKDQTMTVFNALLKSMKDYNTDRRGDVGSWSRIAAMNGLETLSYLAVRASIGIPHFLLSQKKSQGAGTNVSIAPRQLSGAPMALDLASRLVFLEEDSEIKARESIENMRPMHPSIVSNSRHYEDSLYFSEDLCTQVLGSLLKQLAEKLDSVRCQAGLCLERLLTNKDPRLPFVPNRPILLDALGLTKQQRSQRREDLVHQQERVNWSNSAITFPLVMCAVNIDDFFQDIISGIIVSVGGLTESVTKHSTAALLDWIRGVKNIKAISRIVKLGNAFLSLFNQHHKDQRVILPLLKTLDKLLSRGCLDDLLKTENCPFPDSLLSNIKKEAKGCTDVKRLLAIVSVALGLLYVQNKDMVFKDVLPFIMSLLGHKYPRVRCWTAEQLYVKLLEDGSTMMDNKEHLDKAMRLLLDEVWDSDIDSQENWQDSRKQIAALLGVQLIEKNLLPTATGKNTSSSSDGFDCYSSLVHEAKN